MERTCSMNGDEKGIQNLITKTLDCDTFCDLSIDGKITLR
jgi:hypothetical protein